MGPQAELAGSSGVTFLTVIKKTVKCQVSVSDIRLTYTNAVFFVFLLVEAACKTEE
jgi:hypothetical protein